MGEPESSGTDMRVVAVDDERSPLAHAAFELIHEAMWDVQPTSDLLSELEEKRLGLPSGGDYHLLVFQEPDGSVAATASGVYLEGVNVGFITYLAVREDVRGLRLGRELRDHLVEAFREEARRRTGGELAWTVGEVRRENRWLRTLVHEGRAVPFDLGYFHPWMRRRSEGAYVLYREGAAVASPELPTQEVARLLYAIWRRAYRIRYPLQHDTFCYMLRQLEGRDTVGIHPDFAEG